MESRFSLVRLRNCVKHTMTNERLRANFLISMFMCWPMFFLSDLSFVFFTMLSISILPFTAATATNKQFETLIPATPSEKFISILIVLLLLLATLAAYYGLIYVFVFMIDPLFISNPIQSLVFGNLQIPHVIVTLLTVAPIAVIIGNIRRFRGRLVVDLIALPSLFLGIAITYWISQNEILQTALGYLIMAATGVAFWIWAYLGYKHREVI